MVVAIIEKLRMLARHAMDGGVGALNGDLHQVFHVVAVALMAERLVQDFDGRLRRDLSGLGAADAVGDGEDAALGVRQERVFVERAALVQAPVGDDRGLDFDCRRWSASLNCLRKLDRLASSSRCRASDAAARPASRALRCEKAISIPSMAKLVIRLKPP